MESSRLRDEVDSQVAIDFEEANSHYIGWMPPVEKTVLEESGTDGSCDDEEERMALFQEIQNKYDESLDSRTNNGYLKKFHYADISHRTRENLWRPGGTAPGYETPQNSGLITPPRGGDTLVLPIISALKLDMLHGILP
ncbi:putative AAA+ ATPase domain-containing protein [Seiridium unicorne]|uniref:AAA+ ATPase domain-containing protein n=1 Tax=Seiridium unicorne TaxID=138068 RepID=A0ABR2VD92_9PEZI